MKNTNAKGDTIVSKFTVTLFTRPGCMPCRATARALDRRGVLFTPVDITRDAEAAKAIRDSGWASTPVVRVEQGGRVVAEWSGLRVDAIDTLATPGARLETLDMRGFQDDAGWVIPGVRGQDTPGGYVPTMPGA